MTDKKKLKSAIEKRSSASQKLIEYKISKPWLNKYAAEIALRVIAFIEENEEINQTKIADALGVKRQRVQRIIKGYENLTLESIYKLSKVLGIELIDFPPYKYSNVFIGVKKKQPSTTMGLLVNGDFKSIQNPSTGGLTETTTAEIKNGLPTDQLKII